MENIAAWISGPGQQLELGPSPIPTPGENEILIENRAVPIHPADWKIQAGILPIPLTYPTILGTSVAGFVRKVGSNATRFKEGDRVFSITAFTLLDNSNYGTHQRFSLSTQNLTSNIFDTSFEQATSAASVYTALSALCLHLGLEKPSTNPQPKSERVLIWGGSSSVGGYGVQFAAQAGYEVISTASTKNNDYVLSLGARAVFDYKSPNIYEDLVNLGPYKTIWSAQDSAADQEVMGRLLAAQGGGEFLATMGPRPGVNIPAGTGAYFVQYLDDCLMPENAEFTKWLFWDFQEGGMRGGSFQLGKVETAGGLGKVQECLDLLREGKVSAKASGLTFQGLRIWGSLSRKSF